MSDFAAAPIQPFVQGLITFVNPDVPADGIQFSGVGIVTTGLNAPVYAAGDYILTLDPGLPGDVAINPPFGRFLLTVRGPSGPSAGTPTAVVSKSLTYLVSPIPGVGATKIQISLANGAAAPADFEEGLEIILWRGDAGVELVNATLIGPLFQND